ncbi:MAG: hypothetical protein II824_05650 [Bacteroidales bacterium]|nr:hypothetical protein [Bacteroidales bacterium]
MKKLFLTLVLLLGAWAAYAQNIHIGDEIPASAAAILKPRLEQMLKDGGVADVNLNVTAVVKEKTQVASGVVLMLDLILCSGEVEEAFPLKGVGDNEADAYERAMKQFLPRSKAAQNFMDKLKNHK